MFTLKLVYVCLVFLWRVWGAGFVYMSSVAPQVSVGLVRFVCQFHSLSSSLLPPHLGKNVSQKYQSTCQTKMSAKMSANNVCQIVRGECQTNRSDKIVSPNCQTKTCQTKMSIKIASQNCQPHCEIALLNSTMLKHKQ